MLLSQLPPGTDRALEMASQRGYETYVLCVVLISSVALIGLLFRWFINSLDKRAQEGVAREAALSQRINQLEQFVQDTLMQQVQATAKALHENTLATSALAAALEGKPCLLERERQVDLVKLIAEQVREKV
jgi:hypothetical protein